MQPKKPIQLAGAAIIEDGKLLCLFHKKYSGFVFPGGKVEEKESLQHAAIREAEEELGCTVELQGIKNNHWIGRFMHNGSYFESHLFAVELKGELKITETKNFERFEWIPIKEYKKFKVTPIVELFCEEYNKGKINFQ